MVANDSVFKTIPMCTQICNMHHLPDSSKVEGDFHHLMWLFLSSLHPFLECESKLHAVAISKIQNNE